MLHSLIVANPTRSPKEYGRKMLIQKDFAEQTGAGNLRHMYIFQAERRINLAMVWGQHE